MDWQHQALSLGGALMIGVLVGIERGWSLRTVPDGTRVAGLRTFALLGLVGGIAGFVATVGHVLAGGALVAGAVALLGFAYSSRLRDDPDATSAVSALLVLGAGFLSGSGYPGPAVAIGAVTALILGLREELHGFIARLDAADVKAFVRYAVIALAVLPFLPNRQMGPLDAWNPAKLWLIIVLVTGLSFAGYVANRLFGARHGTLATAVIGGAYSSTAVTQSLSERLGRNGHADGPEAAGIALASAVMYLRVIILVAALAPRMLAPFAVLVAPALLVAGVAGWLLYQRADNGEAAAPPGNPIALLPAFGFVAFIAIAAVAVRWAQGHFGESGIAAMLFLMGALDVDTSIVTAGTLPPDAISASLAALAIAGTIVANMGVKIGVTVAYARAPGRKAALALVASTVVLALSIAIGFLRM
jgi:uncharacterized membrane protein (DUF4010 family)